METSNDLLCSQLAAPPVPRARIIALAQALAADSTTELVLEANSTRIEQGALHALERGDGICLGLQGGDHLLLGLREILVELKDLKRCRVSEAQPVLLGAQ